MKTIKFVIAVTLAFQLAALSASAAHKKVAIAILYDTSGSMSDKIHGQPKYVIANNALSDAVDEIDSYVKKGNTVEAGLFRFKADNVGSNPIPLAAWNPKKFKKWLAAFHTPSGGTPLGLGIREACKQLAASPMPEKHLVIITDGENDENISLTEGVTEGKKASQNQKIHIYFVAFNTDSRDFDDAKKLGSLVIPAADKTQLEADLGQIFGKAILVQNKRQQIRTPNGELLPVGEGPHHP